jgi:hypothetical protein
MRQLPARQWHGSFQLLSRSETMQIPVYCSPSAVSCKGCTRLDDYCVKDESLACCEWKCCVMHTESQASHLIFLDSNSIASTHHNNLNHVFKNSIRRQSRTIALSIPTRLTICRPLRKPFVLAVTLYSHLGSPLFREPSSLPKQKLRLTRLWHRRLWCSS